jgi:hypothetical protein
VRERRGERYEDGEIRQRGGEGRKVHGGKKRDISYLFNCIYFGNF